MCCPQFCFELQRSSRTQEKSDPPGPRNVWTWRVCLYFFSPAVGPMTSSQAISHRWALLPVMPLPTQKAQARNNNWALGRLQRGVHGPAWELRCDKHICIFFPEILPHVCKWISPPRGEPCNALELWFVFSTLHSASGIILISRLLLGECCNGNTVFSED